MATSYKCAKIIRFLYEFSLISKALRFSYRNMIRISYERERIFDKVQGVPFGKMYFPPIFP